MSLKIADIIAVLIKQGKESEIEATLDPYSRGQRQCITSVKYKQSSLLFLAVTNKCVLTVAYFLESCGADPDSYGCKDGERISCLAAAIKLNCDLIVDILLKNGANTEIVFAFEQTALFHACAYGRNRIARLLIQHGANVNKRNSTGETPLRESSDDLELFKYLILKGTNVNSVDVFGQTALIISFEANRDEMINFLLSLEDIDVRQRDDFGDDVLHLAVRHNHGPVVEEIIRRGAYTNDEVIAVYEVESCFFHIGKNNEIANKLWQKALELRSKPTDTRMFEIKLPEGKLKKVVNFFNSDDISALLYIEWIHGIDNLLTLWAFTRATNNVKDDDKYLYLCDFYFYILHSFGDEIFFKSFGQSVVLLRCHFDKMLLKRENLFKIFELFVTFMVEIRQRLETMTIQERASLACKIESLLYFTIEFICVIDERYFDEMDLFYCGIRRILKTDLRGLQQKSLTQMCACLRNADRILKHFICCEADVNSTDSEGKSVLHEMIESDTPALKRITKRILGNGFDFNEVRCDEYCLPCRMVRQNIIQNSVKHVSLQCLAAIAVCDGKVNCITDLPRDLIPIVNSHLFLV